MQQYLNFLQHILHNADKKTDRTGVGTISTFGYQMRFNLQAGFPLLTTKKMPWKAIVGELIGFIRGYTNIRDFEKLGCNWWKPWADENGNLGPIYGSRWRDFGGRPDSIIQPAPNMTEEVSKSYLGVGSGKGCWGKPNYKLWQGIMQRCYDPNDIGYYLYGGRGVHMCNRWLYCKNFLDDLPHIPGWENKINNPATTYELDKDILGNGFLYSPDTCCIVTSQENTLARSTKQYTVEKEGVTYTFSSPSTFCSEHNISNKNFSDLWTGNKNAKIRNGFKLVKVEDKAKGFDQLQWVINEIKTNPDSRRLIVTSWDVPYINYMALPPCHMTFQFYVANGELSCQLYQRSADAFLGVPTNIASYALLTHMVAQLTGLEVGEFIWTGGDCHIYRNHLDQVMEQLSRTPLPLSQIKLQNVTSIDDYEPSDIKLIGYKSHPLIKAPIAV